MEGKKYVKKDGVCIGTFVAPILAEIYLSSSDKIVHDKMNTIAPWVWFVRRYIDDMVICKFEDCLKESLEGLLTSAALDLQLIVTKPEEEVILFLDGRLQVGD